jgi:hypothetical protein
MSLPNQAARLSAKLRGEDLWAIHGWMVVAAPGGVGVFTGLLANGGGFLLVPLYLLVLGLPMRTSAGTSLVVIAALTVRFCLTWHSEILPGALRSPSQPDLYRRHSWVPGWPNVYRTTGFVWHSAAYWCLRCVFRSSAACGGLGRRRKNAREYLYRSLLQCGICKLDPRACTN